MSCREGCAVTTPTLPYYEPFGNDVLVSGESPRYGVPGYPANDAVSLQFTGKEKDTETNLNFFLARYYAGSQGRFTSPDEPLMGQDPVEPQSWNLYTYGLNNPLRYYDPSGQASEENGGDDAKNCVNGVNSKTGAQCVVVTADAPSMSLHDQMLLQLFLYQWAIEAAPTTLVEFAKKTGDMMAQTLSHQNWPCTLGYAGTGLTIGATWGGGVGSLGLLGGPTVLVTEPSFSGTGAAIGAVGGGAYGLVMCSGGTGEVSGGNKQGESSGSAQDKKLTSSEVTKLESSTGESAHQIKSEALGTNKNIAQYDLFKDADGNVLVKAKDGVGEAINTGLKIK